MKKEHKSITIIKALSIPIFLSVILVIILKINYLSFSFPHAEAAGSIKAENDNRSKDVMDDGNDTDKKSNISNLTGVSNDNNPSSVTDNNNKANDDEEIKDDDKAKGDEETKDNEKTKKDKETKNGGETKYDEETKNNRKIRNKEETDDVYDTIIISAAGDVTLGRDENYGYERSFDHEFKLQKKDYGYFFRNVKNIFEADDLTIVNLETTLTTATKKADKKFRFKADPSYVEILKQGSVEAVSIANNHTMDYLEKGYKDTIKTLEDASVGYFGYEHKFVTEVRDIKIGVLGYYCMSITDKQKNEIKKAIKELRKEGTDLVIIMFHWGIERDYWPNSVQKKLARFSIDNGADLVLGSHPHVIQGIEEYKGKQIVYSLGNFCFGGNKNPQDKDTMIYVHKFNFKNKELISEEYEIIPCSISSVKNRNNYQPTPLKGKEAERVLKKIKKYSKF